MGARLSDAAVKASGDDPSLDLPPDAFVKTMQPHERVLVDLKDLLYEGSWERVVADLVAANDKKPYIYRLSNAIDRDLKAIERLRVYEAKHNISLSQAMKQS